MVKSGIVGENSKSAAAGWWVMAWAVVLGTFEAVRGFDIYGL